MSTKDDPRDVILAPIVSEKSYSLLDQNSYTFKVHPDANKTEIRQAVEQLFDVKVKGVWTSNQRGKERRVGKGVGRRPHWKRAIVTLREGTIPIFEG